MVESRLVTAKKVLRLLALLLAAPLFAPAAARAAAAPVISNVGVGVSTIGWTWTLASGATEYDVISSTGGGNISGRILPPSNSFTLTGRSTNTATSITVVEYDSDGSSAATVSTAFSGAAQPSNTSLFGSGPVLTVVTLRWDANGNAAGTNYQVEWSTNNFQSYVVFSTQSVAGATVTATIGDLPSNNLISFMVQALNNFSVGSGFDVAVATSIPVVANQPVFYDTGTFALGVSSIAWSWSPINAATGYRVFNATGGAVSPLLGPAVYTYNQTGLLTNTSYQNYVAAFGLDGFGAQTSTASAPATRFTLAAATTGLTLLNLSTATTSISALWGANGNPAGTTYYLMWWAASASTTTWDLHTTTLQVTGLAGGSTLYFTVRARNGDGLLTGPDATYFGVVPSTYFPVSLRSLQAGFSGLVNFLLPTGTVALSIASGTFSGAVTLSISAPAANTVPAGGGGLAALATPIVIQIDATDGSGILREPSLPVPISVTYGSAGLGGISPGSLVIASYEPLHRAWVPLPTTRNVAAQSVTAITPHLSLFQVMGLSAATSLAYVNFGPNPLRPLVNPGQLMTFRNLPAGARLTMFTYIGEKIADFEADATGIATWDGRNRSGAYVASGIYVVLVDGAGSQRVLRVAVEK